MFKDLFRKDPALEAGRALYAAAVEQARAPALYRDFATPDTVEGRFEQVALHVYLIMRRLKGDDAAKKASQSLMDAMFQNMDDSLRELGVGDLQVGKKVRVLAENFYGRIGAYEAALKDDAPENDLAEALARNIYGVEECEEAGALAAYVRKADRYLADQPAARMANGIVMFPDIERAS
ncbi:ubiquinol-cytochrome C chaperone family protein [Hyphococcus luteus]|uniref:Ubiquinol-cytochrome C reductase n=1 Tax=Hyphococcus luteus TaxID=2058213 RepID=A0A2S7K0R3_9PROT|nr:ubiquinol-cytochrome C chaperone family protein [Marinicaulis flavus]PQA86100.1 ubiquinol-cytochrome C reductase [Marinicaulis flavus]